MSDVTHSKIDEIEAIDGHFEKVSMFRVAAGLGISAFGISIVDLDPGADEYPEHDHSADGVGGRMFAKRPEQPDGLRLLALGATPGQAYDDDGTL
jgi:hypothetical protein